MDTTVNLTLVVSAQEEPLPPRVAAAAALTEFDRRDSAWTSRSQIARELHVPDSTLRYWLSRRWQQMRDSRWPPEVVRFFESRDGLAFLHVLLTAAHLVFVQVNDCGLRHLCWFLDLSGLGEFIAASYGAQQDVAQQMEALLIRFAEEEDQRLAAQMPPRQITVAEDETFHPDICLVAMEPVSGFLLLEEYQPHRDAETWNQCLQQKLQTLPVTVCQVVSDEAKALVRQTEILLGVHHSPDLFHVQHDMVQATSLALAGQTERAAAAVTQAEAQSAELQRQVQACREQCPESSSVQALERQHQQAQAAEAAAREQYAACQQRQQQAHEAVRGLGQDYHPFDFQTGQALDENTVAQRLAGHFDQLDQIAAEAGLSAHATQKLAKARRVLKAMQATLKFYWALLEVWISSWDLSPAVAQWLREDLIPGRYLARAAQKADTASERHRLQELSEKILARARSPTGVWGTLSPEQRLDLERKAQACADLFQRSSSCVEGRNGHLALKHHALHQFTPRKLQALTVLHNYLMWRADGTTAAERFYGAAPRDCFTWLLDRLAVPARPRGPRRAA
jgi:hypothetical protein